MNITDRDETIYNEGYRDGLRAADGANVKNRNAETAFFVGMIVFAAVVVAAFALASIYG